MTKSESSLVASGECGIYCIKNILTGKRYIGSSQNLALRLRMHFTALEGDRHHSQHLQRSFNKQGKKGLVFGVIELCTPDVIEEREDHFISYYKSNDSSFGYNKRIVCSSNKGFKQSDEVRAGMAKRMRERVISDETRKKISESSKGRLLSESAKAKLRKENLSPDKIAKMVAAKKGKPSWKRLFSEAEIIDIKTSQLPSRKIAKKYLVSKTTILNILKGQIYSNINQAPVIKIRVWRSGFKHSAETRMKISKATSGVPKTKKANAA